MNDESTPKKKLIGRKEVAAILGINPRSTYDVAGLPQPFTLTGSKSAKKLWSLDAILDFIASKQREANNEQ